MRNNRGEIFRRSNSYFHFFFTSYTLIKRDSANRPCFFHLHDHIVGLYFPYSRALILQTPALLCFNGQWIEFPRHSKEIAEIPEWCMRRNIMREKSKNCTRFLMIANRLQDIGCASNFASYHIILKRNADKFIDRCAISYF